ncbi:MAG: LysR family transcriptional regulator [Rhodobacteraceae bacterium]|jgi:DNA-binding transcriptional LysR family regulator|uniref:LysR family transcriptional regulator n=1 Tax=Albidovulum sp. TaxID=1872424 RepID=UPI001D1F4B83|nr:LysR family transcriptional regulator [uncultured Defluviimonas sp.]MCB2125223.1 LysR family transcriptional regulator [Paracoccaceae bacterium]MCC0070900.1 LysR family transcriptional regulator [Paracoccaceae bacterium]
MQIELIQTFLDLSETRSFNRTAERLSVTQSTVSGRINALERAVGHRLFSRSRAGTELTTAGLRFAPHARALLHAWTEARHAVGDSGGVLSMRIGIQSDLVTMHFNELIGDFRAALPGTAFLFEADYSAQMCADLMTGAEDFAIIFSPRYHDDLHFETVGEITYLMVSTEADRLAEVRQETYIMPHYSYAMPALHAALHPRLATASLSIGQNTAMVALLRSLGGTAYVLRNSADELMRDGLCRLVADAPPIPQPIFAGLHIRNRHRSAHRRLQQIVRTRFGSATGTLARRRVG